jgi:multidrug efflux pump
MGDVVGRLFREFAVTLAITILISAVVSLTLVPMMSARWLKREEKKKSGIGARAQAFFGRVMQRYDHSLVWVIDHQAITLVVALATFVLTVILYLAIAKGLFPTQDTGQLQARIEAAQDVSYARMAQLQQQAARAILQDPDVDNLSAWRSSSSRRRAPSCRTPTSTTSAPSSASTPPTTPCCTPAAC